MISDLGSFIFSPHFLGGLSSNVSMWLLLTPVFVTLVYEDIYKPKFEALEENQKSHDYVVYLVLHFAILVTSFIAFSFESLGDIIGFFQQDEKNSSISLMPALRILGIGLGVVGVWKYMRNPQQLTIAYKNAKHGQALKPPAIFAAKFRVGVMIYFVVVEIVGLYMTFPSPQI